MPVTCALMYSCVACVAAALRSLGPGLWPMWAIAQMLLATCWLL